MVFNFIGLSIVKPDGSFLASFIEWDCREKRRLTLESTFYKADKTVIGTRRQTASWMPVMPGSSADLLFARVCRPSAAPFETAEIAVEQAGLKAFPADSAPVVRRAASGARFEILPGTGQGGWFNLIDEATSEDYWLRAEEFRRISSAAPSFAAGTKKSKREPAKHRSKTIRRYEDHTQVKNE